MAIYRIRVPETYDCSATSETEALDKFHTRLTSLLNSGYDLDTEVIEVTGGSGTAEPDLFAY